MGLAMGRYEYGFIMSPTRGPAGRLVYTVTNIAGGVCYLFIGLIFGAAALVLPLLMLYEGDFGGWDVKFTLVSGVSAILFIVFVTKGVGQVYCRRRLVVDPPAKTVILSQRKLFGSDELIFTYDRICLRVHPLTIQAPRSFDWHGHALTLEMPDQRFSLGRAKDQADVQAAAMQMQEDTGIRLVQSEEKIELFSDGVGVTD